MQIQIHSVTGEVMYECEAASLREAVEKAVAEGADLRRAYLRRADLRGVNLSGANLRGANLIDADLYGADLRSANLIGANLSGADLSGANLSGVDLRDADLTGADLTGAVGFRFEDAPDPEVLRRLVADQIESHPELHDQTSWGDGSADPSCGTPCCVAGWACHLGGGARDQLVASAATRLLWIDGKPMPSFDGDATREDILEALRA